VKETDGKHFVELAIQANINHGVPLTKDELYRQIGILYYKENYTQDRISNIFRYARSRIAQIVNDVNFNTINKDLIQQKKEQETKTEKEGFYWFLCQR